MLYHKQQQLNKVLCREGLTKLFGKKVYFLALKYIVCIFVEKIKKNSEKKNMEFTETGPSVVGISWSALHYKILNNYISEKDIYSVNSPLSRSDINIIANTVSLLEIIKKAFEYRKETNFAFALIITIEKEFFRALINKKFVKEVCIAGHYDRYVCSISECVRGSNITLSVYQHGAVAALQGLPEFYADKIYLQYSISRDIFEKFYICHEYILCGPPDVKRIKEGVKLPRNEFSVLFIGQDKSPELNVEILSVLISSLMKCGVKYQVYHLKHPRDDYVYRIKGNYKEITKTPINPNVVFSRYSSLAYVYHMLEYNVFFINVDDVVTDFMSDLTVNKVSLSQLMKVEY
ncbi:TPA: hypothetical protein RHW67_004565, partial [Escherichia coli]|nr:hypothetical protein [Escherichia coli]